MARQLLSVRPRPAAQRAANRAAAADRTIKVWHARSGKHEHTLEAHMAGVSDVDWAPDSLTLVSGSDDKTVRLWDVLAVRRPRPPARAHC